MYNYISNKAYLSRVKTIKLNISNCWDKKVFVCNVISTAAFIYIFFTKPRIKTYIFIYDVCNIFWWIPGTYNVKYIT